MTSLKNIEESGKPLNEEQEMENIIKNRNEFLFLYDIKNGNPNGDPDENRPRIDTEKCYVTDVRLKRFIRDYLIQTDGIDTILVAKTGEKTNNLTDRIKQHLQSVDIDKIEGQALLDLLLNTYTDLRYFGNPLALTDDKWKDKTKSFTGAIQINFGETLHNVKEATFHGWGSVPHESGQGGATPTTYYGIPYGLIAFHGIANENAAKTTRLKEIDLNKFKVALWKGVRESVTAHTRTKREQQPRLFLNIVYKEKIKIKDNNNKEIEVPTEYHIGSLEEKIKLNSKVGEEMNIRKVGDYALDPTRLFDAISGVKDKIERVEYCLSPEFCDIFEKCDRVTDSKKNADSPNDPLFVGKLKEISVKNGIEVFNVINLDIDKLSVGA